MPLSQPWASSMVKGRSSILIWRSAARSHHCPAGNAMQDVIGKLAGDNRPVLQDDPGIVRSAFGNETVLNEPGVVRPCCLGLFLGKGRIKQLHGLDVASSPSEIRHGNHGNAELGSRIFSDLLRLGKHHQRGSCFLPEN